MTPLVPFIASAVSSLAQSAATSMSQQAQSTANVQAAGSAFSQVMQQYASDAVDSLKSGEAAAINGVAGKMPVQKVVDAVMTAERDLQTVIALRDKVVNAYQEISRLSI